MNSINELPSNRKDNSKPFFLITIDVEGDNLWSRHRKITTRNADFLPRFQSLCDSFGFKPTYLTDYEMANCPTFQDFGRDVIKNKKGEIGMHLHAWNTPPIKPLTEDDYEYVPYLIDYPRDIIEEKITSLTNLLEDNFNIINIEAVAKLDKEKPFEKLLDLEKIEDPKELKQKKKELENKIEKLKGNYPTFEEILKKAIIISSIIESVKKESIEEKKTGQI